MAATAVPALVALVAAAVVLARPRRVASILSGREAAAVAATGFAVLFGFAPVLFVGYGMSA